MAVVTAELIGHAGWLGFLAFILFAVVFPAMQMATGAAAKRFLLMLDDAARLRLYRQQSTVILGFALVALLPLLTSAAAPSDYGLRLGLDARGLAGWASILVLWLGLRGLVDAIPHRPRLRAWLRRVSPEQVIAMTPARGSEMRSWGMLSIAAGIGEELAFRAFLIWFLMPWTGAAAAVLLSAGVFGLGHSYQGWRHAGIVALVGVVLGGLFLLSGTILPAMALHALVDWESGRGALLLKRTQGDSLYSPPPSA